MNEQRSLQRLRTFKTGSIAFKGAAIDCTVRNLTGNGAMLEVETPVGIPQEFVLVLALDGIRKACRIVWTKNRRLGVAFTDA